MTTSSLMGRIRRGSAILASVALAAGALTAIAGPASADEGPDAPAVSEPDPGYSTLKFTYDPSKGQSIRFDLFTTMTRSGDPGTIDWGDGGKVEGLPWFIVHAQHYYKDTELKTVTVTGTDLTSLSFKNVTGLISVDEMPDTLTSMPEAFRNCANLTHVATPPAGIGDFSHLFDGATKYNENLSAWDTSAVTNMDSMFLNAKSFNNVGKRLTWNVQKVTNFAHMFEGTTWSTMIQSWKPAAATDMTAMFWATPYTPMISTWFVPKIKARPARFFGVYFVSPWIQIDPQWGKNDPSIPEQPKPMPLPPVPAPAPVPAPDPDPAGPKMVMKFDPSAQYEDGYFSMTLAGIAASSPVTVNWGDGTAELITEHMKFSHLYTTKSVKTVTITGTMTSLNVGDVGLLSIDRWDDNGASNLSAAFAGSLYLTHIATPPFPILGIEYAFADCWAFNEDLSDWDVSQVTWMAKVFLRAKAFTNAGKPLTWDVSKVEVFSSMFEDSGFNADVSSWNPVEALSVYHMFKNSPFTGSLGTWYLPHAPVPPEEPLVPANWDYWGTTVPTDPSYFPHFGEWAPGTEPAATEDADATLVEPAIH